MKRFLSYLRSSKGVETQRLAVEAFLRGKRDARLVAEVVEIESGNRERPKLATALALCRMHGATLIIPKLGHLSRNASFLRSLEGVGDFIACDKPEVNRRSIPSLIAKAEEKSRR